MPRIPLQSCSMVLQSTNYQRNHPHELKSLLPFAMCNGTPQTNNREHNETDIRMIEHLMWQSSGELPILQSQLIKHDNLSVKISSRKVLNYYCKMILSLHFK